MKTWNLDPGSILLLCLWLLFQNVEGHRQGPLVWLASILQAERKLFEIVSNLKSSSKLILEDPHLRFLYQKQRKYRQVEYYGSFNELKGGFSARFIGPSCHHRLLTTYDNNVTVDLTSKTIHTTAAFTKTSKSNSKILEIDIADYYDLPKTQQYNILDVSSKPGYVQVKGSPRILQAILPKNPKSSLKHTMKIWRKRLMTSDGFLDSTKLRSLDVHIKAKNYETSLTKSVLNDILGHSVSIQYNKKTIKIGQEILWTLESPSDGNIKKWSMKLKKNVCILRTQWWPNIANKWKSRARVWPARDVIDKLAHYVYLIPASEDNQLKYSFIHVERALAGMRTDDQNLNYFIFKILFYQYVRPICETSIQTYIVKTVMLWTCEQFSSSNETWALGYSKDYKIVRYMLTKMLQAFENNFLPNYFLPDINVLKKIPISVQTMVAKRLSIILQVTELSRLIPSDTKYIVDFLGEMTSPLKVMLNFSHTVIKNGVLKTLLKKPKLLQEIAKYTVRREATKVFRAKAFTKIFIVLTMALTPLLLYVIVMYFKQKIFYTK